MSRDRTVVERLVELVERLAREDPAAFRAFAAALDEADREVAQISTLDLDEAAR